MITLLQRYTTWRQQRIVRYRSYGFRTPRSGRIVMLAFFTALFARALPMPGWFYALVGLVLVVAGAAFGMDMIRMARRDEDYRRIVFLPLLRWCGGIIGVIALAIIVVVAMSHRR